MGNEGPNLNMLNETVITGGPPISSALGNFPLLIDKCLRDGSFWKHFSLHKSPSDGLCLMHSLVYSLNKQFPNMLNVTLDYILQLLKREFQSNREKYVHFLDYATEFDMFKALDEYINDKIYNNSFGDIIPYVMSNALRMNLLLIVKLHENGMYDTCYVTPFENLDMSTTVPLLLFKDGEHYDACIPIKPSSVNIPNISCEHSGNSENSFKIANAFYTIADNMTVGHENCTKSTSPALPETEIPMLIGESSTKQTQINRPNDGNLNEKNDESLFPEIIDFRQKFKSNFIFTHVNINSFRHKFVFIQELLSKNCIDYLAISESKLDESFPDAQFNVEGYSLYRQDLTSCSGGLLVYVRSDLPQRRMVDRECNANGIESICIEIIVGKCKTVIACIYKHPKVANDLFRTSISCMVDKLIISCSDLILLGDMNCCPTKSKTIKDICDTYDLSNLIKNPTCHKAQTPTLLDVILVSNPKRYIGILNSICNLSDFHNMIGAATKRFAPSMKPRRIQYRSYKNLKDSDFTNDIMMAPFHVSDIFDDIEDAAWFSSKLINDIVDDHAPMRVKTIKCDSVPYMNSQLRKAQYQRNMVRNKFKLYGKAYWEENRRHRNNVVSIRKKSMSKYFSENCAKKDKTFWSTIKPFMTNKNSRNGNNIILNEDGSIVNDPKDISNVFNDFFSTVATAIGFEDKILSTETAIRKHATHPSIIKINGRFSEKANSFKFMPVSPATIMMKLKSINVKKATGYDNIPGKLLRIANKELAFPITNLLNRCITENVFPSVMKYAEVSPVYKKSDNMLKENFRPVSVLTTTSKLFETIMNDQLYAYFENLFDKLLSAFRKGYSCQSLLVKFVENLKESLDKGHTAGAIFMDLSKAFDCLPHNLLIAKLNAYGLDSSACDLLASYLTDRRQRVKIGSTRSEWVELKKGVPQGSILGPLLFNVFMNDMFYFIEKCVLYRLRR